MAAGIAAAAVGFGLAVAAAGRAAGAVHLAVVVAVAAYVTVTGFSIGMAYVPALVLLAVAGGKTSGPAAVAAVVGDPARPGSGMKIRFRGRRRRRSRCHAQSVTVDSGRAARNYASSGDGLDTKSEFGRCSSL